MLGEDLPGGAGDPDPAGEDGADNTIFSSELGAAAARISDLDAGWFKRRPARAHRFRAAVPGEFGPLKATVALVRQIRPGIRMRLPLPSRPPCVCEACLAHAWNLVSSEWQRQLAVSLAAASLKQERR